METVGPEIMKILVIIPTFNERENIPVIIQRLFEVDKGLNVLVVDDNSPDGTGRLLDQLAAEDSRISVIHKKKKEGIGPAYVDGIRYALGKDYDVVVTMDADLSHNPRYIPAMLKMIKEFPLVVGSRWVKGGGIVKWPFRRWLQSRLASVYSNLVLGIGIKDFTGGFNCYRREALESLNINSIRSDGYSFQIEMKYRIAKQGFRWFEMPIVFEDRTAGVSKISRRIVIEALLIVWYLRFLKIKSHSKAFSKVLSKLLVVAMIFLLGCTRDLGGKAETLYALPETNLNHVGGLAWSPSGEWLLFHSQVQGETKESYALLSLKDRKVVPLPIGEVEDSQNFSPDGAKILFSDGKKLYAYEIAREELVEIPVITGRSSETFLGAVYSPDGREIAFCGNGTTLYLVPSQGGQARVVVDGLHTAYWIRWNPDRKFLFVWLLEGPTVARVEIESGRLEKITRGDGVYPLSDGKRIVYLNNRLIHLRDLDRQKSILLSREPNVRDIAPSWDGQKLALVQENRGRFYLKMINLPREIVL